MLHDLIYCPKSSEFHKWVWSLIWIMLSCPRCGIGNFKEGQSLSMHLTGYCRGPSLLCHAQRGIMPTKCSNEEMLSDSCPTAYQQQIRNFNSLTDNLLVPTINTLYCMPSLLHLLSTQSELGTSNMHYSGFDIDFSTPESADDHWTPIMI